MPKWHLQYLKRVHLYPSYTQKLVQSPFLSHLFFFSLTILNRHAPELAFTAYYFLFFNLFINFFKYQFGQTARHIPILSIAINIKGGLRVYEQSGVTQIRPDCEVFVIHCTCPIVWIMEQAAMETIFWALPGIEPGTLCTRVKDLNDCATLLLNFVPHFLSKKQISPKHIIQNQD